jgi:hypothetical protein
MSKKNKTKVVEIPPIYQTLTAPTKESAGRKVIVAADRSIHALKDATVPIPPGITVDMEFTNFDDLTCRQQSVIESLHLEFIGCEPPEKQSKMTTALYLWAWFVKNATPHLENIATDGTRARKSTISTRCYSRGAVDTSPENLTPQAKVCLTIFIELIGDAQSVAEGDLRRKVEERAAELKTKQDPWRIFQYYRPTLIALKLIKHD